MFDGIQTKKSLLSPGPLLRMNAEERERNAELGFDIFIAITAVPAAEGYCDGNVLRRSG